MKTKLVVGNWKMNGRLASNITLLDALVAGVPERVECAVCVPYPYLAQVQGRLAGSRIALGAQNVSEQGDGAHTGEVSVGMLSDFGCRFVIVGHSERRHGHGELDALVAAKADSASKAGLTPIICVGETLEERDAGQVEVILERQLAALETRLDSEALSKVVLAYEPVWAIGTGRSASPEQVQLVLSFIRTWLSRRITDAGAVKVLYGGSVKADSARELFELPDADGGLVGGASLVASEFLSICRAAASGS